MSTDDPGIFDYDLTTEYKRLHAVHGMTLSDFAVMNRVAFNASFVPENMKVQFKDLF